MGRELAGGAHASSGTDLASWRSREVRLSSGMVGVVVKRPDQRHSGWERHAIHAASVSISTVFHVVSGPDLLGWWMSSVRDPLPVGMVVGTDEKDSET